MMACPETHNRHVGDTLTVLSAELTQKDANGDPTVVNLTGKTVKFKMVSAAGVEKVAESTATVISAAAGTVYYQFLDADVDTAGTYYGYFLVYDSGKFDTFPAVRRELKIVIHADY